MKNERWHLHRAYISNYWYFDEASFEFSKGKLLLRGANGSGKSITTASLLPLLLDGKIAPSRLDPFGSASRKIEEYLLGEKDLSTHNDRTGYLAMEYRYGDQEVYFTSGMGIRARRGKSLDRWYFILTDNSRIGLDFPLWHELGSNQRRPFSERELIGRLNNRGRITKKQKEYAEWINKYLFAFDSMETFNQMIQLQLDIRKPKLSKDFAPTEIYRILEEALPQLKDDDLHEVSDSLENIETSKNQLQQNEKDLVDLETLKQAFDDYHLQVQGKYATHTLRTKKKTAEFQQLLHEKMEMFEQAQKLLEQSIDKRVTLDSEQDLLKENITALEHHDLFRLEKEQLQAKQQEQQLNLRLEKITSNMLKTRNSQQQYQQDCNELERQLDQKNQEQQGFLLEMEDHVEGTGFKQHTLLVEDFNRLAYEMNLQYWRNALGSYQKAVGQLLDEVYRLQQTKQQKAATKESIDQLAKEHERLSFELHHYEEMFQSELTKTEVALAQWQKILPFSFSNQEWQQMLQRLNTLFSQTASYEQVKEPLIHAYQQYQLGQKEIIQEKRLELNQLDKIGKQLYDDLSTWRQKKLPEPQRRVEQTADRLRLHADDKKVVSFYEVIDFTEDITQDQRNQLEAALYNSGILDALVCEEPLHLENEQQLVPNPQLMAHTLADYLEPSVGESGISEGYVLDLLQSIVVESEDLAVAAVDLTGTYHLGIYRGKASNSQKSQFIGKESQKQFLEAKIAEIEGQILRNEAAKEEKQKTIDAVQKKITNTQRLFEQMPDSKELEVIQQEINNQQKKVIENQQRQLFQEQQYLQFKEQQKVLQIQIRQLQETHDLIVSEDITALEKVKKQLADYQGAFEDFYDAFTGGKSLPNQIRQYKEFLATTRERYEQEAEEQQALDRQVAHLQKKIVSIEEQLALEGFEEIRQQIKAAVKKQEENQQQLHELNTTIIPQTTSRKDALEKEVRENKERSEFYELLYQTWLNVAERELLRYQQEHLPLNEVAEHYQGEETLKKGATMLKRVQREKMVPLGQYSPELVESAMTSIETLETREWSDALVSEVQLLQADSQNEVLYLLDEQNHRTSVMDICQQVQAKIEELKFFIDAEDHKLFEEILLNSIGNSIKGLISKTEQWVKKMNAVLKNTKDENRLRLSIRWVPKTSDREGEMHTTDLVRILRQPAAMLTTEDLERMIRHFREKINYAKTIQGNREEGEIQTLHEVMKEVLDYRHWFKFILRYQKDNEPERELTNPRFYKLSGGEKAVAMYLPLFTAMYARFEDAKADAPRMVCLDEAFAGVDELNIADLFGLLEDLGFDYLLNSQALWGDYDTVSSLNIYQLLRKANSTTVGLIQSHWKGKKEPLGEKNED